MRKPFAGWPHKKCGALNSKEVEASPFLQLFGRPTTRQWGKLPGRILALDRDGRSDPIARFALCHSTIAERRSGSTTGCGRVLSQPPRDRHGSGEDNLINHGVDRWVFDAKSGWVSRVLRRPAIPNSHVIRCRV